MHVVFGKHDLRVVSCLQVIAAQAGKVFDTHNSNLSILNQIQHLLEIWPVVVRPGVPVVHEILAVGESIFFGILAQQRFLCMDQNAVAVVFVVAAEPAIIKRMTSPKKRNGQETIFLLTISMMPLFVVP